MSSHCKLWILHPFNKKKKKKKIIIPKALRQVHLCHQTTLILTLSIVKTPRYIFAVNWLRGNKILFLSATNQHWPFLLPQHCWRVNRHKGSFPQTTLCHHPHVQASHITSWPWSLLSLLRVDTPYESHGVWVLATLSTPNVSICQRSFQHFVINHYHQPWLFATVDICLAFQDLS